MARTRWARLQTDWNFWNLRRGAWYRLLKLEHLEAVVDVNRKPVTVLRAFVEISASPPRRWTVVPRPRDARALPPDVPHYAVCPSCRDRVTLDGRPRRMQCQRCRADFEVAWDEQYLAHTPF